MYAQRYDRPRILITSWRRPFPTYLGERTILDTLRPRVCRRVSDAGGLPLIVSATGGPSASRWSTSVLALADGLLLTGGGDVDPATYGAAASRTPMTRTRPPTSGSSP